MEIWKDVVGYEGVYLVSNYGNIKRIGAHGNQSKEEMGSQKILKHAIKDNKYHFVALCKNGKVSQKYVHRLVALSFIPNPLEKKTVNHKDGDRNNNHVDNLEWATYSENNIHSINVLNRDSKNSSDSKPVLQFDKDWKLINEYPSMREAQRQTKIIGIEKVCNQLPRRKTAGGFNWRYKVDYNNEKV